jgi:DNA repair protein RadC
VALNAQQVVVFLLRPGGYAEMLTASRFTFRAISLLARSRGSGRGRQTGDRGPLIRMITAVVAAGPRQWRAPADRGGARIWVRGRSAEPDQGARWHPEAEDEIRWALAVVLAGDGESRGGLGWAEDLIAACGGIAGLASSRPQDLPAAGIPAERRRRVAGVVELAGRLAVATVPRRPRASNGFPLSGYLRKKYRHEPGELGLVVMLDRNHRVVGEYRTYGANDSADQRRLGALPARFMPQAIAARAALLLPVTLGSLIAEPAGKGRELWFHEADGRIHVDLDRPEDHRALDDQSWLAPAYGGAPGPRCRLRPHDRRSLRAFLPLDNPRKPELAPAVPDPLHRPQAQGPSPMRSQQMATTNDQENPQPQGPAADVRELLCQTFGVSDPERVDPFLGNGLFDSIWRDVEEIGEHYDAAERRRICAAQTLVRSLARVRLDSRAPDGPEGLVPDLFLAHSDPHRDVVGALYYTEEGVPVADRVLFRGYLEHSWISMHQVAAPALWLKAPQVVIFLLRPGADTGLYIGQTDFPHWAHSLLYATWATAVGAITAGGPLEWESERPGLRLRVRAPSPTSPPNPLWRWEAQEQCRRSLAVLLAGDDDLRGGERLVEDLLAACGGLAGLAVSPPEDLPAAGIPAESLRRVAGVLELTRRLAVARVPPRPVVRNPHMLYRFLSQHFRKEKSEIVAVLLLDRYKRVVGVHRMDHEEHLVEEGRLLGVRLGPLAKALAARAAILFPVKLGPLGQGKGKRREVWFYEHKGRLHVDLDHPEQPGDLSLSSRYERPPAPRQLRQYKLRELQKFFFPLDKEYEIPVPEPQIESQ